MGCNRSYLYFTLKGRKFFFFLQLASLEKGGDKNGRLASPANASVHLKQNEQSMKRFSPYYVCKLIRIFFVCVNISYLSCKKCKKKKNVFFFYPDGIRPGQWG